MYQKKKIIIYFAGICVYISVNKTAVFVKDAGNCCCLDINRETGVWTNMNHFHTVSSNEKHLQYS